MLLYKKYKKYVFLLLSFCIYNLTIATSSDLKVSVIIPCHYKHVVYLYDLLKSYELQTTLPDEIILALSEINLAPQALIAKLKNENWKFPVKYTETNQQAYAGNNRNAACKIATGDIFVCQDADDLPNRRRIEIIKFLFNTHDIDHLMHGYYDSHSNFKYDDQLTNLRLQDIKSIHLKQYSDWHNFAVHNGNIAIRRHVFDKIQWENRPKGDEDVRFNEKVYKQFKHAITLIPLIHYRWENSAFLQL